MLLPDQSHKIIIGRKTGQTLPAAEVGRHGGNTQTHSPLPVGIHRRGKAPLLQYTPRLFRRQADRGGNPHQFINPGDVDPLHKIGPVDGMAELIAAPLLLRPLPQLLSQPAVVGAAPFRQRQTLCSGNLQQSGLHVVDHFLPPGKELGKLPSRRRGFGVEREATPAQLNPVFLLQSVGTHGTEVAPGSNVIKKNLYHGCAVHGVLLINP